jgi:hypothetical protein
MIPAVAAAGAPFVVMHWRGFLEGGTVRGRLRRRRLRSRRRTPRTRGGRSGRRCRPRPHRRRPGPRLLQGRRARPDPPRPPRPPARELGHPVLVAASRKRFLGRVLAGPEGAPPPARERDAATAAVSALAAHAGRVGGPRPRGPGHRRRRTRRPPSRERRPRGPDPDRRGSPVSAPHTDVEQVELANTAFYEALERGDFEELSVALADPVRPRPRRGVPRPGGQAARSPASTPAGRCSPAAARS